MEQIYGFVYSSSGHTVQFDLLESSNGPDIGEPGV
jgi:hypothetical protein